MLITILLWVALFFLLLLLYFLYAPLLLEIDSRVGLYRFSIVPVFHIRWVTGSFPGYGEISILGFRKKLQGKTEKNVKVSGRKIKKVSAPGNYKKILAVLHSFRVKKWFVNIDTGDMALNGELFPLVYWLNSKIKRPCQINFQGKTEVIISIENNAFRMMKAFLFNN